MITIIAGTNQFLIQAEAAKRRADFAKKYGESAVESYGAEQLDQDQLQRSLTAVSLFADHRLIILKNISQSSELSERFLAVAPRVPEEFTVLLIEDKIDKRTTFYKTLKKEFELLEYTEVPEGELLRWITQEVRECGGVITASDAQTLLSYVGADQLRLKNEIEKLVAFNPTVSQASIDELVERKAEDTVFQLLDASLSGRTKQALAILDNLERANEDPFATANMLIWQTHIVAIAYSASGKNEAEVAKDTKVNPYVLKKARSVASRLSKGQLRKIIDSVAQMDVLLKTTSNNPWRILEHAILSF